LELTTLAGSTDDKANKAPRMQLVWLSMRIFLFLLLGPWSVNPSIQAGPAVQAEFRHSGNASLITFSLHKRLELKDSRFVSRLLIKSDNLTRALRHEFLAASSTPGITKIAQIMSL